MYDMYPPHWRNEADPVRVTHLCHPLARSGGESFCGSRQGAVLRYGASIGEVTCSTCKALIIEVQEEEL